MAQSPARQQRIMEALERFKECAEAPVFFVDGDTVRTMLDEDPSSPAESIERMRDAFNVIEDSTFGNGRLAAERNLPPLPRSARTGMPKFAKWGMPKGVRLCVGSASDYGGPVCANCSAINDLKKCGRCRAVYYCSADCQKLQWACHKPDCVPVAHKKKSSTNE